MAFLMFKGGVEAGGSLLAYETGDCDEQCGVTIVLIASKRYTFYDQKVYAMLRMKVIFSNEIRALETTRARAR